MYGHTSIFSVIKGRDHSSICFTPPGHPFLMCGGARGLILLLQSDRFLENTHHNKKTGGGTSSEQQEQQEHGAAASAFHSVGVWPLKARTSDTHQPQHHGLNTTPTRIVDQ
jgi:hypothetical protein